MRKAITRCAFILLPSITLAMAPKSMEDQLQVWDLRCEYLRDPAGIDVTQPRLSWKLNSAIPDQTQTAYQILAASSRAQLTEEKADLWNTGKVASGQNVLVIYTGETLRSKDESWWKVRVWDKDGRASDWSETASWGMGILKAEDWEQAKWIGSAEILGAAEQDVVPLSHWIWHPGARGPGQSVFFRREIHVDAAVAYIKLDITAYHKYRLYVNGKLIGEVNRDWNSPTIAHYQLYLDRNLVLGNNTVAIEASSRAGEGALVCGIEVVYKEPGAARLLDPLRWSSSDRAERNWHSIDPTPGGWVDVVSVARYGDPPFGEVDRNPAMASPLLRKEITIHGRVATAMVYMSGLGFSELYINGIKSDNRVLDPEFLDYTVRVPYVAKNVTGLLQRGTNVIGVILGGGAYKATTADMFDFQNAPWSDRPKLLLQMDIEYADGGRQVIVSDTSWKSSTGAILFNCLRGGETIDLGEEKKGWMLPHYEPEGWRDAVLLEGPEGRLVAQQTHPARIMEDIDPVRVEEPTDGVYVFDMGVNMTGWSAFEVRGENDQIVIMDYNEALHPDGTLDINHEATHTYGRYQMDKLILSGEGREVFEPRFTQHSFRYVQATGLSYKPGVEDLKGKWVHTDIGHAGTFECSDERLNEIQRAIVRGYKNYILHHPIDPLREKMGWTQDVWNMFEAGAYNFEIARVFKKWFGDFLDAQDPNGHVPPVIPANDWGRTTADGEPGEMSDPWWGGAMVYLPWFLYDYYGDMSALEEGYASMKRYVDYVDGTSRDSLVYWTLGDWGDVSHMERGAQHRLTPVEESSTGAFYYLATLVEKAAILLGERDDAEKYGAMAVRIKNRFNEQFFDEQAGVYRTRSQSAQVLPLYLGLVPTEHEDDVLEWIVEDIRAHDNHLTTGFVGILPLLDELSMRGRTDVAFALAVQETYPSWHNMLKGGGTTITEYWDPERGSRNIVNLGAPLGAWFYKYLAGIRPIEPSFRRFTLQPYFADDLDWMNATFNSSYGEIVSHWERSLQRITYEVKIPVNTHARVSLPVSDPEKVTINGIPLGSDSKYETPPAGGQSLTFTLGSGDYTIRF